MGMFDDLIPQAPQAPKEDPRAGGLFDDLIPGGGSPQRTVIPDGDPSITDRGGFDAAFAPSGFKPSPELKKRFGQLEGIEARHGTVPGTWRDIDRTAQEAERRGLMGSALQGASFGFGDEAIAAAKAAAGAGDYATNVAGEREGLERYRKENPVASTAAEFAGILPTLVIPGLNVMRGAGLGARMANAAATGAAYGALYGAGTGEGAMGRAGSAASGSVLGGLFGGAAPVLVSGAKGAGRALNEATGNLGSTVRGVVNPEKEASRIVARALERDNPHTIDIPGFVETEMTRAQSGGQPLAVGDMGTAATRSAARSAANTSPEAREALEGMVMDRSGVAQTMRIENLISDLMGGSPNAAARQDALREAARRVNKVAYDRAYQEGDAGVWNEALSSRFASDAFRKAVQDAGRIGSDVAGASGERAVRNPFVFDEAGRASLKIKPTGQREIPNLRFWDKVKQSLDSQIGRADRSGDRGEVSRLTELKKAFVADLDAAVPSYAEARRGAAAHFGAEDALEAGQNFVTQKFSLPEVKKAMSRMSPAERQLFAEGYASRLVDMIKSIPDNRNVAINILFNNPVAREKLTLALGEHRAASLESYMRVENIMDMMKRAVTGNSNTARQLIEAGLAGATASGVATGSTDPVNLGIGAIVGGLTRKGAGRINENVARRVGEMLASNDPKVVRQAFQRIGQAPGARRRLIDVESTLSRLFGNRGGESGQSLQPGISFAPSAANEKGDNNP